MRKRLVSTIILCFIFLSACTSTEVETGIDQKDVEKTAQFVTRLYNKDNYTFENKDYGNNIGILPTYIISDEFRILSAISLNKEEQVESIFFEDLSKEQVEKIFDELKISDSFYFEQVLNYYDREHKTKYQNIILELNNNPDFSIINPHIESTYTNEVDEDNNFHLTLHYEPIDNSNSIFSIESVSTVLGILGVVIGGYYIIVNAAFIITQTSKCKQTDLERIKYNFYSNDDIKKSSFYFTLLFIIPLSITYYNWSTKSDKTELVIFVVILLSLIGVLFYMRYVRKQRTIRNLTVKYNDQIWYLLLRTDNGFIFSNEKNPQEVGDAIEEMIYLKEDEVSGLLMKYVESTEDSTEDSTKINK